MTFVQIGEFDWLSGRQKGSILVKMLKNLLLRNHTGDEAETWHTCLGHKPLHSCVFYSGQIRTLVAMATYSSHRLIMGKVEIDLQKYLLSSPPCFIRLLYKSLNLIG